MSRPTLADLTAWLVRPTAESPRRGGFAMPVAPGSSATSEGSAGRVAGRRDVPARPAPTVALLAAGADAGSLGASIALAAAGAGTGVLGLWRVVRSHRIGAGVPPVPAARRIAGSLVARGLAARAGGRLVAVELADDDEQAVAELRRLELAAGIAACTVVLGAPWAEPWRGPLLTRDHVLVHAGDLHVAGIAVERLRADGACAAVLDAPPTVATRVLAARGLAIPGSLAPLRRAVGAPR